MKPARLHKIAWILIPAVVATACGRHRLRGDEVERNRLFAEILSREDHRDPGTDGFFQRLLGYEGQPMVQQWAAVALSRIGEPATLPWLFAASRSRDAATRASVAFAIGEIEDREQRRNEGRRPDSRTSSILLELLADSSTAVRSRAIEAIGKAGESQDSAAILTSVRGLRSGGDPSLRALLESVITALVRLKPPEAEGFLATLTRDPDPGLQWRALNALQRLQARSTCEDSRRLIASRDVNVRAYAARGLGTCGDRDAALTLEPLLGPRNTLTGEGNPLPVRVCAVQSLGKLAQPGSVEPIARALASDRPDERHPDQVNFAIQASAALASFETPQSETALASLLTYHGPVANSALVALGKILRTRPERFFELMKTGDFAGPAGARARAQALGELGGESASSALKQMLVHAAQDDPQVADVMALPTVLVSLARTKAADLAAILPPYLASHDPVVLRAALEAYLPVAAGKEPWRPIADAFRGLGGADDPETKVALLNGLEGWLGESGVREFLVSALQDRNRNARIAAARLLRQAGVSAVPQTPGPADVRAGSATYAMLAGLRRERTVAVIETNRGNIEVLLFREEAPVTTENFCTLAKRGFFDGLTFMRVVPFFVIQGGDPRNDMEGGPGYSIRCEINMHPFERGSVGMALAGKDTGGSQFFIALAPQPQLDGGYTCFGRVVAGMAVADRMAPGDRIVRVRIAEERATLDYRQY
jgi:cyclophilin family peptidyl-prolyl cis-trans isomerase/HEAT repeat protein